MRRFAAILLLLLLCPQGVRAQSWTRTGDLTIERSGDPLGPAATLLADGRVLVTGGRDGADTVLQSAELYDSVSESFTATGSMGTPRAGHTATRLSDGKVLIAGGEANGPIVASCEIYDPTSGTFSPAASMGTTRSQHAAVLLASGEVLILGGENTAHTALASAELYDPASDVWTPAGGLTIPRRLFPRATRLLDGRVLITGGELFNNGPIHSSAEIYDPGAGTFTTTGSMAAARANHTATRLQDGTVLVAGGFDRPGGAWVPHDTAEVYDPSTGAFSTVGLLQLDRGQHGAVLLPDGRVLLAGGGDGPAGAAVPFSAFTAAELYDPASGSFASTASMVHARLGFDLVPLEDGTALAIAGHGQAGSLGTAEYFNPAPVVSCVGFDPPLAGESVAVRGGNRALPCKATLIDDGGFELTDQDLLAPPVIQVLYTSSVGGDPVDVTDDALPAGQSTDGNQFAFTGDRWQFNLKTKNYSAPGTYTILLDSGDRTEYVVSPTCTVDFVISE